MVMAVMHGHLRHQDLPHKSDNAIKSPHVEGIWMCLTVKHGETER